MKLFRILCFPYNKHGYFFIFFEKYCENSNFCRFIVRTKRVIWDIFYDKNTTEYFYLANNEGNKKKLIFFIEFAFYIKKNDTFAIGTLPIVYNIYFV